MTRFFKTQRDRDLSSLLFTLGSLFLTPRERNNRSSQIEETLADTIGLDFIILSGYNPYDAAAFFGRLQMYGGTTDPAARQWNRYRDDHPLNEDRIDNLDESWLVDKKLHSKDSRLLVLQDISVN